MSAKVYGNLKLKLKPMTVTLLLPLITVNTVIIGDMKYCFNQPNYQNIFWHCMFLQTKDAFKLGNDDWIFIFGWTHPLNFFCPHRGGWESAVTSCWKYAVLLQQRRLQIVPAGVETSGSVGWNWRRAAVRLASRPRHRFHNTRNVNIMWCVL